MSHHCHATECGANVPPTMFVCKKHWFSLPKPLRDAIWATYRPGQCDDWNISKEYAEAARAAIRHMAAKEGKTPDTSIYDTLEPGSPTRNLARILGGKENDLDAPPAAR